jgi:hypothetical protein
VKSLNLIWSRPVLRRFLVSRRSINAETGCWEYIGGTNKPIKGYGIVRIGDRHVLVHRLSAWTFKKDPRARRKGNGGRGTVYCHKCDNPKCFRPSHIFAGSNSDNIRDYFKKFNPYARTHCIHGHEMTPENTFIRTAEKVKVYPEKECRTCMKNRSYRQYWKSKGKSIERPNFGGDIRPFRSQMYGPIEVTV